MQWPPSETVVRRSDQKWSLERAEIVGRPRTSVCNVHKVEVPVERGASDVSRWTPGERNVLQGYTAALLWPVMERYPEHDLHPLVSHGAAQEGIFKEQEWVCWRRSRCDG